MKKFFVPLLGLVVVAVALVAFAPPVPDDPDPIPDPTCGLWGYLDDPVIEYNDEVEPPRYDIYVKPYWGDTTSGHTSLLAILSYEIYITGVGWTDPVGRVLVDEENCDLYPTANIWYGFPETGWDEVKFTLDVYCPATQSHVQDHKHVTPN
jgi:hypothetical protein